MYADFLLGSMTMPSHCQDSPIITGFKCQQPSLTVFFTVHISDSCNSTAKTLMHTHYIEVSLTKVLHCTDVRRWTYQVCVCWDAEKMEIQQRISSVMTAVPASLHQPRQSSNSAQSTYRTCQRRTTQPVSSV